MNDPREVQWIKDDGSKVALGASLPAATYWIELPGDRGPHSVQVSYDNALAASGGVVQFTNNPLGDNFGALDGTWSDTPYTLAAIVAGSATSKIVLIPDNMAGRRRFEFTVTTPGVGRAYIR